MNTDSKKTYKKRRVYGTRKRPRLAVFRSHRHIYAQIIDDEKGVTIASASDVDVVDVKVAKENKQTAPIARATGKLLAQKAQKQKITAVVFDRNKYRYHGRVKALADGAREGGLHF